MNPGYSLKGVSSFGEYSASMNLERNLCAFFDYGSLALGGFNSVYYNSSGAYGGNLGRLAPAKSYQYASGKVWEGYRPNWVWESGYAGTQPVPPTGIYINGTFTTSGYNIDYRYGQVVLDSGISNTSTVRCSFSTKSIWWDIADSKWFRELATELSRVDLRDATGIGSGTRTVLTNHRVPLPAVVVEVTTSADFRPLQLGGGQYYKPKVNFHVFAESPDQKKFISDLIMNQNDHSFLGVDFNKIKASGDYIYNGSGFLNIGAKTLPNLYANYPWNVKPISFMNMNGNEIPFVPNVYRALIQCDCELVLPMI